MSSSINFSELLSYIDLLKSKLHQSEVQQYSIFARDMHQLSVKDYVLYDGIMDELSRHAEIIIIDDDLREIKAKEFSGSQNLRAVFIPHAVNIIGEEAFKNCENLETVFISSKHLSAIGDSCFFNCQKLRAVNSRSYIKRIGVAAFKGCIALESIEVHANEVGPSVFENCISLESAVWGTDAEIQEKTFKNCVSLNSMHLHEGIKSIGDEAFDGCTSLKECVHTIHIDGYTSDGKRAGGMLEDVVFLPENLESIGKCAFRSCSSLRAFELPYELVNIGDEAFINCAMLEKLELHLSYHTGMQKIILGKNCFSACNKLVLELTNQPAPYLISYFLKNKIVFSVYGKNIIYYPDSPPLSLIQEGEYSIKTEHGTFEFDTGVLIRYIGSGGRIQLPESTLFIAPDAFTKGRGINGMNWDYIALGDELIEYHIAEDGIVQLPEGLKNLNCSFKNIDYLRKLILPEGLETIGSSCFSDAENLSDVVFPSTLKKIGSYAFSGCINLNNVELPACMEEIEDFSFSSCDSLENFICNSENCAISKFAFL